MPTPVTVALPVEEVNVPIPVIFDYLNPFAVKNDIISQPETEVETELFSALTCEKLPIMCAGLKPVE